MRMLERIRIRNYKSIRDQTLLLKPLNVFIGSNGAGKSNLIGSFRFLKEIVGENLAGYTAIKGGAESLLHFGRKASDRLSFELTFGEGSMSNGYLVDMRPTDDDGLVIWDERARYHELDKYPTPFDLPVAQRAKESKLRRLTHVCATQVARDLDSYRVYHFHDTSDTATVKGLSDVEDNRFLRSQAENLASFLYWMQEMHRSRFQLVEAIIAQIAPFFGGFVLEPSKLNADKIRLQWREKGSDSYFSAASLSDGTLRFICLATLLLQPELPSLVLLDEPELGLHPAAINLLAELLLSASARTQLLVATQSVTLVNQFEPQHLWTVDRRDGQSVFEALDESSTKDWLSDYSLGELWEKNILGARP
ncbi:AAA family ATPase [Gemmatimonas sp.]|uniref:AAA family ATPase n=1 Tax=Gemmatimonas sp. TaxID=1962908 RepID=UPI00286A02CC|nr:AAA family ATPase [Gemmatimonas sp.]